MAAQQKRSITYKVRITGVRDTLAAFRALPREASDQLRTRSFELAQTMAGRIKSAASAEGAQAALLSRTVRAVRDRVPVVQAGGSSPKLGRYNVEPRMLLFASEFGMNTRSGWYATPRYRSVRGDSQYKPHTGQDGYWFFPTANAMQPEIDREWNAAADAILDAFGGARG